MTDMTNLIGAAVAAKMTPDFIEKEVATRVDKLIVESIDKALRSYSDTGKLIEKAVEDALRVDRLDLPAYGETVKAILQAQIEARVAPLVAGQLAADMDELLGLAPKAVKLSAIADSMRQAHEGEGYGPVITVIVEETRYGSRWLFLDDEHHHEVRDKYKCKHRLMIADDGRITGGWINDKDTKASGWIGRSYGLEQKLRAYIACGTVIELDEDYVSTSVGDY
jgi:hypothetical protein